MAARENSRKSTCRSGCGSCQVWGFSTVLQQTRDRTMSPQGTDLLMQVPLSAPVSSKHFLKLLKFHHSSKISCSSPCLHLFFSEYFLKFLKFYHSSKICISPSSPAFAKHFLKFLKLYHSSKISCISPHLHLLLPNIFLNF